MAQELALVSHKKYEKGLFTIMELNLAKSMYAISKQKFTGKTTTSQI